MMLQRLFLSLLVAIPFLLLSYDSAAQQDSVYVVDYPVLLTPNPQAGQKEITAQVPNEKKCRVNAHDGCMLFSADTIGAITFYLAGSPNKTSCADLSREGARRVITKVELSTTPMQNDMATGVFGERVDAWLKHDAFPGADISNGLLYQAELRDARTSVSFYNENRHPYNKVPRQFWYKVTVTDCDDPRKIWIFDPRGDNEGKH